PPAPPPVAPAVDDAPVDPAMAEAEKLEADLTARTRQLEDELRAAGVADGSAQAPDPAAIATSLRASGASADDVAGVLAALGPPPADVEAPAPAVDLRQLVEARIARREPLSGLDLRGADLRDLDLGGQVLKGSDLSRVRLERTRLDG